jgi:hypothetical protein
MLKPVGTMDRFHGLLPKKVIEIRERNSRTNGNKAYNFFCKN